MISRFRTAVLLVLSLSLWAVGLTASAAPVSAQSEAPVLVQVSGRGWGHGRGLGQYGAQGYAADKGWSAAQILDHFYGGTTAGPIPAGAPVNPNVVRVDLRSQQGQTLRAGLGSGVIHVRSVAGDALWDWAGSVQLSVVPGGIKLETGPSCSGPWTERFTTAAYQAIDLVPEPTATGKEGLLSVCQPDGSTTWYPGYLRYESSPVRTVNIVTIEEYLRGVVPSEVPSSWHPEALKSQAVAARSYSMAGDTRQQPYADTCDTTLCQVYKGYFRQTAGSAVASPATASTTDAAVAATAGIVRLTAAGTIARTEFSSSTGGYTAGGSFPAVPDDGDATATNPNRSWTRTVDLRAWINAQAKGDLISIEVAKTGLGPDGGRSTSATFRFTGGVATLDADKVRQAFNLNSDWFSFGSVPVASISGANYVNSAYSLFVRRVPDDVERNTWVANLERGTPRASLTQALARSDEWAGVMIDDLYLDVFGRPSDSSGRAYWLGRMGTGLRFEAVAANFYGSPEYFRRSGGTNSQFVAALYRDILGRPADQAGLEFWTGRLDLGRTNPGGVSGGFYASVESRSDRVHRLYRSVLGRGADPAGAAYWADRLLSVDDVTLAALLAASDEFFINAQS